MFLVLCALLASLQSSPDAVRRAAAEAVADDIQTRIPTAEMPPEEADARSTTNRSDATDRGGAHRGWLGRIANLLLWVLCISAAAIGGFWLVGELAHRRDVATSAPDDPAAPARVSVVDQPLEDAEALATRGLHAAAIHALLQRTLAELRATRRHPISSSLTSREILGRLPLGEEARRALSSLVDAVEVTHFGGATAGEPEYRACVEQFRRFAATYAGEA
jgi:hypothetical protein